MGLGIFFGQGRHDIFIYGGLESGHTVRFLLYAHFLNPGINCPAVWVSINALVDIQIRIRGIGDNGENAEHLGERVSFPYPVPNLAIDVIGEHNWDKKECIYEREDSVLYGFIEKVARNKGGQA